MMNFPEYFRENPLWKSIPLGVIFLGWLILAYMGVDALWGPLAAIPVIGVLFGIRNTLCALVATGFAFWGAYAGLKLAWYYAALLCIPTIPAIVMGCLVGLGRAVYLHYFAEKGEDD
jgi:hypothetical protein